MKKGSFSALLCRELICVSKAMKSYIIMMLIMVPMPFLCLLSFRHGNLGMLIPEEAQWIFLGVDGSALKLFILVGGAALAMCSSDSMGCDIALKWDHFRRSTPVPPEKMALAKITVQAMFSAAAIVISTLLIWLMDIALGVSFSATDVAMALTMVAAITLLAVLALLFVTAFKSVDKGMLILMGCLMAIAAPISLYIKNNEQSSGTTDLERMTQIQEKAMDFYNLLLPFLPFILIGTLALGVAGLTLLYKRREK